MRAVRDTIMNMMAMPPATDEPEEGEPDPERRRITDEHRQSKSRGDQSGKAEHGNREQTPLPAHRYGSCEYDEGGDQPSEDERCDEPHTRSERFENLSRAVRDEPSEDVLEFVLLDLEVHRIGICLERST